MYDEPKIQTIFNLHTDVSLSKKFEWLTDETCVTEQTFKTFSAISEPLKTLMRSLSAINFNDQLYTSVELAKKISPGSEDIVLSLQLHVKGWAVDNFPDKEPVLLSLDIGVMPRDKAGFLSNIPESMQTTGVHWCAKMDKDDETITQIMVDDCSKVLKAISELCVENKGHMSGTDLLHCIFTYPQGEAIVSVTVFSQKVIIV